MDFLKTGGIVAAGETIRSLLTHGDRRSIGRVEEVLALVKQTPARAKHLSACLWDDDGAVRMRAADAMEKLSREQPQILQPFGAQLLSLLCEARQKELRWHLAVMVPRLRLKASECRLVSEILVSYLEDTSSIVKVFALQGLADLTRQSPNLRPMVVDLLRVSARTGTAAMRARARRLLQQMETAY